MKLFSDFYDALLPELPGIGTAMVDYHLLAVAREFCERTSAWRDDTIPVPNEPGRLTYALVLPDAYVDLVRMTKLTVDGVLKWQDRDLQQSSGTPASRFLPDQPPFTLDQDSVLFTLDDQPLGPIVFTVALKPSLDAPYLPDVLFTQHLEAMRTGTLSRLMTMGGKRWSNPDLASQYGTAFDVRINRAHVTGQRGNVRAPLRTKPTLF